ncbi:hypothetical protein [Streptomyces sp. WAC06614]|uniref:hypothetical protein n=1 Tax=Streptomyces sp. WAC06614 TaxID=2487416 RepID=UPI000F78DDFC|nr:hypothetical protein [Streptomyces sp. WAC06614]RSS79457.1 hypothetical protein EF918_17285 [Streptomyces sp. WAC06614]
MGHRPSLNRVPNRRTTAILGAAVLLSVIGGGSAYAAAAGPSTPAHTISVPDGTQHEPGKNVTVSAPEGTPHGPAKDANGDDITTPVPADK